MKIAVAGKGGAGKTTVSGTLARSIAAEGYDVLALDDDDDPNLPVPLGVSRDAVGPPLPDELVSRLDPDEHDDPSELTQAHQAIIEEYGIDAPDGITLLTAGTVEAGTGCFGTSHVTVRRILSQAADAPGEVTLMDLPNGIEHLGLATAQDVDVMLVVVEPTYKSMETVAKIQPLAAELGIPEVQVVANKIRTERDRAVVADYCADHDLPVVAEVPFDDAIRHAEREGAAPVDYAPDSRAVGAIREFATELVEAPHVPR